MWNILLFEDADDTAQDIDKDNLTALLDMLFEEMGSETTKQPQVAKVFASGDVLDILQSINQECFKNTFCYETKMGDIDKGTLWS